MSCHRSDSTPSGVLLSNQGSILGLVEDRELVRIALLENHVCATTCLLALAVVLALDSYPACLFLWRKWLAATLLLLCIDFAVFAHHFSFCVLGPMWADMNDRGWLRKKQPP